MLAPLPRLMGLGTRTIDGVPLGRFAWRLAWVAIRLVLVYYLGQTGALFFYQGF